MQVENIEMEAPTLPLSPPPGEVVEVDEADMDVVDGASGLNPLDMECIVKQVLSHHAISLGDLLELRLLNKVWNEAATREMVPHCPVILPVLSTRFPDTNGTVKVNLPTFLNTLATSLSKENFPYRKFLIYDGPLVNSTPEEKLLIAKFFEDVAPLAIQLQICLDSYDLLPAVNPQEGIEYSRLKSFELYLMPLPPHFSAAALQANVDFIMRILGHTPKLDTLILRKNSSFEDHALEAAFSGFLERVPWNKIRDLQLNMSVDEPRFQRLLEVIGAALKLSSFEMDYKFGSNPIVLGSNFQSFLERQRGTLETLKLDLESTSFAANFNWPQFTQLKNLQIGLRNQSELLQNVGLLALPSYSQWLPALHSLTIQVRWWSVFNEYFWKKDVTPVETVKILKLEQKSYYYSSWSWEARFAMDIETESRQAVQCAARLFPRVEKLSLPGHYAIMKAVDREKAWGKLEDLTLQCHAAVSADYTLTGYTPRECVMIRQIDAGTKLMHTVEMEAEQNMFQFLNRLKILKIVYGSGHWPSLSDVACRLVVLKLENLKCFDLQEHHKNYISKAVIREMRRKFKVLLNPE